jgi:MinD-like ATPase involved in chromosome partitioning or flagellar assembly
LPRVDGLPVLSFRSLAAEPSADVADAVLSALSEQCELVVVDAPTAGGAVADAALRQASRIVLVAGDGLRSLLALSAVSSSLRKRPDVAAEIGVCLRVASAASARAVARLVEAELRLDVLGILEDDRGVHGDLVNGVPPGSRGRGPLVRAADDVLGWVVLSGRGVA